jgi:glycerate kinase
MRVLAAFDKFKDSVSAPAACEAAAVAVAGLGAAWSVDSCPMSDGGEGFADALTRAAGGHTMTATVTGPRGAQTPCSFGVVEAATIPGAARELLGLGPAMDRLAVLDMASASGLALLKPELRDPMLASSEGTGELILAAAAGADAILLGVGGSATSDFGLGAMAAMGIRFVDETGRIIERIVPANWHRLAGIEGTVNVAAPPIRIACDVDNPLLGPRGAASVYGPQKGLRPVDGAVLEREGERIASMVCRHFGRPRGLAGEKGAGAAGGMAFGLMAATGARILPGFELVCSWLDLRARLACADVILTGEGRFDDTSLAGKGPGAVVRMALALGKKVHLFAGQVSLSSPIPGLSTHTITPPGMPLAEALACTPALLRASVREALVTG